MKHAKTTNSPITNPAQVSALAAPARQEVIDVLETAGPCSVAQLATLLAKPADGLYHHLRMLLKVGLIYEVDRRLEGRHAFVIYDVVSRPVTMSYAAPAKPADITKVIAAAQRLSLRDFRSCLAAGDSAIEGPEREIWGARVRGYITKDQLQAMNGHLASILKIIRTPASPNRKSNGRIMSVSFVLTPVSPEHRPEHKPASKKKTRKDNHS